MAGSVNKVILVGNLGRDPEIRTMQSGGRVAQLSLATSESWKDRNSGERREKTEWHRVVIFNENLVQVAERFLKKGSKIYVEGQIETRKWQDQSGVEKYTTEIVLRPFRGELTMLEGRGAEGSGMGEGDYEREPAGAAGRGGGFGGSGSSNNQGGGGRGGQGGRQGGWNAPAEDLDDEIPF